MGSCCCKESIRGGLVGLPPPARPSTPVDEELPMRISQVVDPDLIERLIREMLAVAATQGDSDVQSPVSLVKLHVIADKDDGWIQMVLSMITVIPIENPFGPAAISLLLEECPLPSKETVIRLTQYLGLSAQRTNLRYKRTRFERNICIALGCIAQKLVGPNSVAILTDNTLDYLLTYLSTNHEPCIVLFALIAIKKFSLTSENKLKIKSRLDRCPEHPLLVLENYNNSDDLYWRQVGFCARWALDNVFIVEGRSLSYETVDMSGIHAILKTNNVNEYLQISSNGLEARCDSYSLESVRCTFEMNIGCWYYEAHIVTAGVMYIGFASRISPFLSTENHTVGGDQFSTSYDGSRTLMWYNAEYSAIESVPSWEPGDVLGCLLDLNTKEIIFSLNGRRIATCRDIFKTVTRGFFASATFMAYQQCRFNFGYEMFRYPPTDRQFEGFNGCGCLTVEQKQILPKRLYLEKLKNAQENDHTCMICFDNIPSRILEPCGHRGFCSVCTKKIASCPLCRSVIQSVRKDVA